MIPSLGRHMDAHGSTGNINERNREQNGEKEALDHLARSKIELLRMKSMNVYDGHSAREPLAGFGLARIHFLCSASWSPMLAEYEKSRSFFSVQNAGEITARNAAEE